MNITKSLKFGFSLFCRVLFLAFFFFFRTCFFYFVVDEWRNYFTSVIGQYNRLLSKIGRFKTSGEFSITNSLKLDFSLFCRVLLLPFFSYLFLFRVVLFFSFISIPIYNWEAFSYFQRPTANIIKKAYNGTE